MGGTPDLIVQGKPPLTAYSRDEPKFAAAVHNGELPVGDAVFAGTPDAVVPVTRCNQHIGVAGTASFATAR
ncbi:hypothetical protein ACQY0O_002261 [Thecaphora frezii]